MSERIFIGVAWPYANGSLHLGHVAGAYLPADIFARYHRMKGNEVLMVSGSDTHGTPITIKAEEEGKSPEEIAERYHLQFLESWKGLGISFDLFTHTNTENHARVAREIFTTLMENGYIYKETTTQAYCSQCRRFLADRYIEGTCPNCGATGARGDQCDACGKPLNPSELRDAGCRQCGTAPEYRETEHFFLKLSAFQDRISDWIDEPEKQETWKSNVLGLTKRYLNEGLKDRAISRDIAWGVPVPVEGYEDKSLYVWFEAVIGYFSASREWAESSGSADAWKPFWEGDISKSYYFIGKDNIPFHTIIWPAILMGRGGLNLPWDVPSNEFLTFENRKGSKSRNWAVWVPDYLSRYDPDPLRYILSINMPESSDTDFSWREFVRRNNDELVATYGNLANRVLTFVYKNFDGCVPEPGEPDEAGKTVLENAKTVLEQAGLNIARCRFREALRSIMALAQEANRYLDDTAPWKTIKEDRQAAATSLYVTLGVISCLKTMMYPFLPFSSQKLHEYLGFEGSVEDTGWNIVIPEPGQKLVKPAPLFTKLDEKVIEEESARLGATD